MFVFNWKDCNDLALYCKGEYKLRKSLPFGRLMNFKNKNIVLKMQKTIHFLEF